MTRPAMKKQREEDKQQAAAFRKAARELECDPSENRFQKALRTVAKAKPQRITKNKTAKD